MSSSTDSIARPADWLSFAAARAAVFAGTPILSAAQRPLIGALGGVLAEDLISPIDLPRWNNSAMDGFAARTADVLGATADAPVSLAVLEDVRAGAFPTLPLRPGTATRVMTGAPVPQGADCVIRVEHTDRGTDLGSAGARVEIRSAEDAGKNVRPRGQDLRKGERVLEAGRVLRAAELGIAASIGYGRLSVIRRPVVGILTSGDELVDVDEFGEVLAGRRIVSSNSYTLAAQVIEAGAEPRLLGIASDDPADLHEHILRASGCDLLVTSAGISVGEHDQVKRVLAGLGLRTAFWRVKIRPGSPVAFGWIDALGGIPWFGLPGNPVSSMVTFELFVRPALLRMAGRERIYRREIEVRLEEAVAASSGLTLFMRAVLGPGAPRSASLTGPQGSGILSSMAAADALVIVPEGHPGSPPGTLLSAIALGDDATAAA
jgi:molybdopterin molybdotransferase